ncbi:hypothetical protein ACWDXD_24880 [Streptomyces sp. NPDC003314]
MAVSMEKPSDLIVATAEEIVFAVRRTETLANTARLAQLTATEARQQYDAFLHRARQMTPQERATLHGHGRHDFVGLAVADVMRERREFG